MDGEPERRAGEPAAGKLGTPGPGAAGWTVLTPRVSFHDLQPEVGSFLEDAVTGLSLPRKALNPKYFYDDRGCELFEAICDLPEYYPTRTEIAIMHASASEMARCLGPDCVLIEFGSGSGRKTPLLLAELAPVRYVPIDIAGTPLRASAAHIGRMFPNLDVAAVCADYTRPLDLPLESGQRARRVIYFPGSTIGNFSLCETRQFLGRARSLAGPGGAMLVGVDLKKDPEVLRAAYDDSRGVTAAFNLNLLARINRELGADFDLSAFRHRAFYNADEGRVEMHLESLARQSVLFGGRSFSFEAEETIHTESSHKYSVEEFHSLARDSGFVPERCWVDPQQLFAVHYLHIPV